MDLILRNSSKKNKMDKGRMVVSNFWLEAEFIYEKRHANDFPLWLMNITVPEEAIYIRPRWIKNEKEYEVCVIYYRINVPKHIEIIAAFPERKQALEYCYEQYLMDKLSGVAVRWHGPDPEEFLEEE